MSDARSRTRELHISTLEVLQVPERVFVLERASHDVGPDEELGVRVGTEAGAGGDAVFVDDAQGAEGFVLRMVVGGEGESVECVEPAVVGVAAGGPGAGGYFEGGGCHCR